MECLGYGEELSRIVGYDLLESGCDYILASGGVDTSFVATSVRELGLRPRAITVALGGWSPDLPYSKILCDKLGLRHELVTKPQTRELVVCEEVVLRTLRTIDPVEVACDIPVCIGLRAASPGSCVATGDGGDELFLGYDFLLEKSSEYLNRWLEKVLRKDYFSSELLGREMGVGVKAALFTNPVKKYSTKVPMGCRVGVHGGRRWGKLLLRLLLDNKGLREIAWRKKTPVLYGSGADELIKTWYLKARRVYSSDDARRSGLRFPSYPHYYLYKRMIELGIDPPPECHDPGRRCRVCGRCVSNGFCRFCGSSETEGGLVSHYSDELWSTWAGPRRSP